MSIFISHSHNDKEFADKIATALVTKRIPVFVDRWEMQVGDSITTKIEQAITDASYLIIILSKNSVASNWCKREITSGLLLELDRKRVVLLPLLIEDCEIPLFLKDKFYADFRTNFDFGFEKVVSTVAHLTKDVIGRLDITDNYYTDFTSSWGKRGEYFELQIDVVDFSILPDKPYTVLTNIVFVGNKNATKKYDEYLSQDRDWQMKDIILMLCSEDKSISGINANLIGNKPFQTAIELADIKNGLSFHGTIIVKRLGVTDGKDKIYYVGRIFEQMWEDAKGSR